MGEVDSFDQEYFFSLLPQRQESGGSLVATKRSGRCTASDGKRRAFGRIMRGGRGRVQILVIAIGV